MDFNEIYEKYHKLIWYCLKNIYSKEDAEDLSQEIWMTIWQKWDHIEPNKEVSFIYSVCRNKIGNFIRTNKFKKRDGIKIPIDDSTISGTAYDKYSEIELLDEIKSILDDKEFLVYILYVNDYTQTEIAEMLKTHQPYISEQLNTIRGKLKYFIK